MDDFPPQDYKQGFDAHKHTFARFSRFLKVKCQASRTWLGEAAQGSPSREHSRQAAVMCSPFASIPVVLPGHDRDSAPHLSADNRWASVRPSRYAAWLPDAHSRDLNLHMQPDLTCSRDLRNQTLKEGCSLRKPECPPGSPGNQVNCQKVAE